MRKVKAQAVDYVGSIEKNNLITINSELGIFYDTAKEQVLVCRREDTIAVSVQGELEAVAMGKYPNLPPHMRLGQMLADIEVRNTLPQDIEATIAAALGDTQAPEQLRQ